MAFRWAGRLMMVMAVVDVVGCLIAAYYTQALMIDLVAIAVYHLGQAVTRGNTRAAKWSLGIMALYMLTAVIMLVGIEVAPERMRIVGQAVTAGVLFWMQWSLVLLATWSAICAALLLRGLRESCGPTPRD